MTRKIKIDVNVFNKFANDLKKKKKKEGIIQAGRINYRPPEYLQLLRC